MLLSDPISDPIPGPVAEDDVAEDALTQQVDEAERPWPASEVAMATPPEGGEGDAGGARPLTVLSIALPSWKR